MPLLRAPTEPGLRVILHSRRLLRFADDGAPREVPHVRAASGLCWLDGRLHIVQDDALSIARVTPEPFALDVVDLPLREDGARFFDKERGNKAQKPDLEACISVADDQGVRLIGFGSGSTARRTSLLLARPHDGELACSWFPAPALYTALEALPGFLSSELNIEGAASTNDGLRLFQRSNGTARGATPAQCASCDVPWDALFAYLDGRADAPALGNVQHYALGALEGVPLSITCALFAYGELFLLASAEASPNAVDDGAVAGSVLGVVRDGRILWGLLRDEQGAPIREKAEGIAEKPGDPQSFYVVFDPDDHSQAASLAELTWACLEPLAE